METRQRQPAARPSAIRQLRSTVLRDLRTMALLAVAFAVAGAAATEATGAALERSWPTVPTHIAAAVIALALAYGAVVTVALRATIRGVVGSLDWIVGEIEGVAGRVAHDAEPLLPRPEAHAGDAGHAAQVAPPGATWERAGMAGGVLGGLAEASAQPSSAPATSADGRGAAPGGSVTP
jgi:hypothetical protein